MDPNKKRVIGVKEYIPSSAMPQKTEEFLQMYVSQRKSFERKWYDNNFFDDGYHFRYISKATDRIIDTSSRGNLNVPIRAIPKASRQIRGIANLLLQPDFTPVIYPEKITPASYPDPNVFATALQEAKTTAKKIGNWMTKEWENQELIEKLTHMVILAAKNGISYIEVWPDPVEEKICSQVFDAFDIYLDGSITSIYDSPVIIKTSKQLISKLRANEYFDEEQVGKLIPDNKYASSEIKEAYMKSRYGNGMVSDKSSTVIQNEVFMKEYLSEYNYEDAVKMSEKTGAMEGKKKGDVLIRHTFTAAGVTLMDEYVDLPDYPIVDFRFEPGPIYQTPLIERFIPANKSMDIIASRIERYINTMTAGSWLVRKGENMQITNIPGGQQIEYTQTPPTQMGLSPIPPHVFEMMNFYQSVIEEQGSSASALGTLPPGVKSGVAIESVKAAEYANLKIAGNQLKNTVKRISEKMIDIADKHFLTPQTVYLLNQGEPQYFDVIGQKGIDTRVELNRKSPGAFPVPQAVPIKSDYVVDIDVESGLGFTMEGRKQTMQQITQFILPLAQMGLMTQDAVKVIMNKFLDTYNFGATQDFMDALETGQQSAPLNEEQITSMKVAVVEALKEAGVLGQDKEEEDIMKTKVGMVEAMRETGMLENQRKQEPEKPPVSVTYKDLPPEGQAQAAAMSGIQIDPLQIRREQAMNAVSQRLRQEYKK